MVGEAKVIQYAPGRIAGTGKKRGHAHAMIGLGDNQAMNALVLLSIILLLTAQVARPFSPWPRALLMASAVCVGAAIVGTIVMWEG